LLQKAIEKAGALDTQSVAAALDSLDLLTFFGHLKFDTTPEAHGLQIGHSMIYIQWVSKDGKLVKEVVWPTEGATMPVIYPLR
jgi:branched-chain amino acid transport system substrate-binding protein